MVPKQWRARAGTDCSPCGRVLAGAYRFLRAGPARPGPGVREIQKISGDLHGVRGVMKVELIRTDGTHEWHTIRAKGASARIQACHDLMGCELSDTVNFHDGRVMLVDDAGWETEMDTDIQGQLIIKCIRPKAGKEINPEATRLYRSVCRSGTTHQIVGDVILAEDRDFA